MGQYHKLVNLDKKEYVEPLDLGMGSKQYEHTGGFDGSLADAMYILTMTSPASGGGDFPMTDASGRWAGDRVVILGDYTSDNAIPTFFKLSEVYAECNDKSDTFTNVSPLIRDAFQKVWQIDFEHKKVTFGKSEWMSWERLVLA